MQRVEDDPVIQAILHEKQQCVDTLTQLSARRQELTNILREVESQISATENSVAGVTLHLERSKRAVHERYSSFEVRYNVKNSELISSLPDIVLEQIFTYLPLHKVCGCIMVVCRRWQRVVMTSQDIWRMWCAKEMLFGRVDPMAMLQAGSARPLRTSSASYKMLLESLYKTEKQWKKTTPIKSYVLPCIFSKQDDEDEAFVNIRVNKKSQSVCCATTTGIVCEWDMHTYSPKHVYKTGCAFDEVEFCGNYFVSTEYSNLAVWEMNTGNRILNHNAPSPFTALCVSDTDNDTIFTANGNILRMWSLSSALSETHQFRHTSFTPVQHFAFRQNILVSVASNTIMVWDVRMRERLRVLDEKAHYVVFNGKTIVALEGYGTVLKMIEFSHDPAPLKIKLPSLCSFSWGMCLEGNKLILPFGACVDVLDIRRVGDVFPSLDFNYFVNYVDTHVGSMFCGLENGTIQCLEF